MTSEGWESYIPLRRKDRGRNAAILAEMNRRMPPSISDELEQNQRWWEREYEALKQQCFPPKPFDPAEHDGHELIHVGTYTTEPTIICAQCREPKDY